MMQLPILGISLYLMLHAVSGIDSTVDSQALAPANSTIVPTPVSVFFLCITINNRVFNESLKNQSSEDYKELREELTQLLDDVYTSEPYNYSGISTMTFSKGSVVANTTIVFRTTEINSSVVENTFLSYVKKNPPPNLDLNITEEQEIPHQENGVTSGTTVTITPRFETAAETTVNHEFTLSSGITNTKATTSEMPPFTQTVGSTRDTTRSPSENNTTISSLTGSGSSTTVTTNATSNDTAITSKGTTESPSSEHTQSQLTYETKDSTTTSYPLSSSTINPITNFTVSQTISSSSTRNTHFPTSSTSNDSLSETSSSQIYSSSPTVHPPVTTATTAVITSSHNTTIHSTEITNATSLSIIQSSPLPNTTDHRINSTSSTSESSATMSATTFIPSRTSPHPSPGTTATHASSLTANTASTSRPLLGKTTSNHATRTTSEARPSPASSVSARTPGPTAAAAAAAVGDSSQVVPGWAIALLVLTSLVLLFLILLFIVLLVYWCCKRRQYDFMNMSEDPGFDVQANHATDIPMYTTHSHLESSNGRPYEDMEKPKKNRTMYTVSNP